MARRPGFRAFSVAVLLTAFLLFLLLSASPARAVEQFFGPHHAAVVHWLDGSLTITSAWGKVRRVDIGDFLLPGDILATGSGDRADILFRDGSSLVLGSDAKAALLDFVHDRTRDTGQTRIYVMRGPFAVEGGRLAARAPAGMTVVFPRGAADLRGGRLAGVVLGQATRLLMMEPGRKQRINQAVIRTPEGGVELLQIGTGCEIPETPVAPSFPRHWSYQAISLLHQATGPRY